MIYCPFLEESTKGYKPLILTHTANQHLHFISLDSCYTKFNSTFGMDNRVLINNLSDSHQATSNEWFLVWIRDYLFCEKLPRLQFKLLLVKCIVKNTIACKTNP